MARRHYKELSLRKQIQDLEQLQLQRAESSLEDLENLISLLKIREHQFDLADILKTQDVSFYDSLYTKGLVCNTQLLFWECKALRSESDIKLERLRKLLSAMTTSVLSRTIIDNKSIFRTKVQLLFKNLDDAHSTILFFKALELKNSYFKHQYPLWKKNKYRQQYASPTIYYQMAA